MLRVFLLAGTLALLPAGAGTIDINFESVTPPLSTFYSSLGIYFDAAAEVAGPVNFNDGPGSTGVLYSHAATIVMNTPGGFTGGLSFRYTAPVFSGAVSVWDQLNGQGALLGSAALGTTGAWCDGVTWYSCWSSGNVGPLSGTARSVTFNGTANMIAWDNITFTSDPVVAALPSVPEPATMCFVFGGFALLAAVRLRRR